MSGRGEDWPFDYSAVTQDDYEPVHLVDVNHNPYQRYSQAILTGFIASLGLLFNGVVILIIFGLKDYKKTSHWYVLNLALADSTFLLMLPFYIHESLTGKWSFGIGLCVAYNCSFYMNYYAGIFFLVVMSFDRYVAIVHSMSSKWRKIRSNTGTWFITICVWILAASSSLPVVINTYINDDICTTDFGPHNPNHRKCIKSNIPLSECDEELQKMYDYVGEFISSSNSSSFYEEFSYEDDDVMVTAGEHPQEFLNRTAEQEEKYDQLCYHQPYPSFISWVIANYILTFAIPVGVMFVCYGLILWRVLHPKIPSSRTCSYNKGKKDSKKHTKTVFHGSNRRSHRITIIVVSLVVIFIACWFPFHLWNLLKLRGVAMSPEDCNSMRVVVTLIAFSNSMLNPVFYTFLGANFNRRLKRVWRRIQTQNAATKDTLMSFKNARNSSKSRNRHRSSTNTKTSKVPATDSCDIHAVDSVQLHSVSPSIVKQDHSESASDACRTSVNYV